MAKSRVKITAVKILGRGFCPRGIKVGDEWTYSKGVPEGFCEYALHDIFPELLTISCGGNFEGLEDGTVLVCCTDGRNPVVFKLERVEE